jgi:hypothetical protein
MQGRISSLRTTPINTTAVSSLRAFDVPAGNAPTPAACKLLFDQQEPDELYAELDELASLTLRQRRQAEFLAQAQAQWLGAIIDGSTNTGADGSRLGRQRTRTSSFCSSSAGGGGGASPQSSPSPQRRKLRSVSEIDAGVDHSSQKTMQHNNTGLHVACELVFLDLETFEECFLGGASTEATMLADKVTFLKASLLFPEWTSQQYCALASDMTRETFPKDAVLLNAGDKAHCMYFILSGDVCCEYANPTAQLNDFNASRNKVCLHLDEHSQAVKRSKKRVQQEEAAPMETITVETTTTGGSAAASPPGPWEP